MKWRIATKGVAVRGWLGGAKKRQRNNFRPPWKEDIWRDYNAVGARGSQGGRMGSRYSGTETGDNYVVE